MAGSIDDLVRDLRRFDGNREVLKALRKRIRQPLPEVKAKVKGRALWTLPRRGGLGAWVGKSRVSSVLRVSARSVSLKLKGSRKSLKNKSDLNRLDAGTIRAPSWGKRGRGSWHIQTVVPGYFTVPTTEAHVWRKAAIEAIEDAVQTLERG